MKKTILTCLITLNSLLVFSQDTTANSLEPVKSFLLNDFKTADLLKNVKGKSEAVDSVLKNKQRSFLALTDSIQIETLDGKVKSIKIYSCNDEYDSTNEFSTLKSQKNELAIDTNAKMNIMGKAKQHDEDNPFKKWAIQEVIAKATKTGYTLILKRTKS